MKKRLLSTLICVIIALSAILSISIAVVSANNSKPVIAVSQVVAESGEEFDLSVSVSGNTGIAGMQIKLSYDADIVAPVLDQNDKPEFSTVLGGQNSINVKENEIEFVYADYQNYNEDGEIITFTFTAQDGVIFDESDIVISSVSVFNADEQQVDVNTTNAKCYVASLPETGTQTSSAENGVYSIRFVGRIDSAIKDMLLEDGNSFGFELALSGDGVQETAKKSFTCEYLMNSISGSDYVSGGQDGVEGKEYFALTVYNVPVGYTCAEYSVWFNVNGINFVKMVGTVNVAPVV